MNVIFIIVEESYSSEIGRTMNNNNKFANLLQSINLNSSSRQLNSLTSITVAKTHTTHFTLTCGRNSLNTIALTKLILQTSASADIPWTTHPNYMENGFTFKQRDDDSRYGDDV